MIFECLHDDFLSDLYYLETIAAWEISRPNIALDLMSIFYEIFGINEIKNPVTENENGRKQTILKSMKADDLGRK